MQTALQTALKYAGQGWSVFPIVPGTKVPYKDTHWKEDSTNDPEQINLLNDLYPDSNWALDCGKSGIFVLDVDTQKGATPPELDTYTVRTPSGGYHLYYKGAGPNSGGELGLGLDTRGIGGYVLIPGSKNAKGKTYTAVSSLLTPQPIPPALLDRLAHISQTKHPLRDQPLTDMDLDHNIARAIDYLVNTAPEAHDGGGGNNTTYKIACRLRDYGLSEAKALELMLEHWNPVKAIGPWTPAELLKIVRSAYDHAKDRPGNATAESLFPDIVAGITGTDSIRRVADIRPGEIKPRGWLLGYRYLPGYVTLTIAPGGVGKSLFTILEAVSVASGRMLTGDKVHGDGGTVWLYNTEDPFDELERRFLAVMKYYGIEGMKDIYYSSAYKTPMTIASYDVNKRIVVNEKLIQALIAEIKRRNIKLFIVDPLIECHDLAENDNPGMNKVIQAFRRIAFETQCAVSLVHHSSKGDKDSRGNVDKSRGASSITSAARIAHTLYPMSLKEAKEYGLSEIDASWYVRLDDAKSNLGPPIGSKGQKWFKKVSVVLSAYTVTGAETADMGVVAESTGTMVLMDDMVRVVADDEVDNMITDSVMELVGVNENKSVYSLSREISAIGIIQLRSKTLQNRIENLFSIPIAKLGYVWRLSQVMALNNKPAVSITCVIDD